MLDDIGQTILSYTSHVEVLGDLQPSVGVFQRDMQGALGERNYVFTAGFNADVRAQDRAFLSGQSLEVVNVEGQLGLMVCDLLEGVAQGVLR